MIFFWRKTSKEFTNICFSWIKFIQSRFISLLFRILILPYIEKAQFFSILSCSTRSLISTPSSRFAFFLCASIWPEAKFYLQRWRDAFCPIAIFDQKTVISDKQQRPSKWVSRFSNIDSTSSLYIIENEKSSHRPNPLESARERKRGRFMITRALPWQGRGRSSQLYSLPEEREKRFSFVRLVGTFSSAAREGPTLSSSLALCLFICLFGFCFSLVAGGAACKQAPVKIQKPDNTHLCAFLPASNAELVIGGHLQPKAGPQTGFHAARRKTMLRKWVTNK